MARDTVERHNHEKDECAEGNEAVSMMLFGCWEGTSVLHFSKGRGIGEKGIFNLIEIKATVSEFAELS